MTNLAPLKLNESVSWDEPTLATIISCLLKKIYFFNVLCVHLKLTALFSEKKNMYVCIQQE